MDTEPCFPLLSSGAHCLVLGPLGEPPVFTGHLPHVRCGAEDLVVTSVVTQEAGETAEYINDTCDGKETVGCCANDSVNFFFWGGGLYSV